MGILKIDKEIDLDKARETAQDYVTWNYKDVNKSHAQLTIFQIPICKQPSLPTTMLR